MRLALLLLLLVVFAPLGAVQAQEMDPLRRPAIGSYDVVALMVEFQPDTTRFSTGDGTFEGVLFDTLEPTVDPLPHDHAYFGAHLEFLRNYVHRVSDGLAEVRTHLVPGVVRVSGTMGAYAPTGPEADDPVQRVRLARLVQEAWTLADEQLSFDAAGLDPARTAFLIFHAGVGRDVELTGTTLDRTPEDLPSLYVGPETLDALLPEADISFKGLQVEQSLILPRTETRRGVDFVTDEPFLIEISINGMLAASFFNYLGVPDLFDTASGQSAIGPFGVMDPLGIFAYNGLFPPEPSAWTRYFLGWTEPVEIRGADSVSVTLQSSSLFGVQDVARVWVSESEYFLLENRHRDPGEDDLHLTVVQGGERSVLTFENAEEGFNGQNISAFPGGVVVDADNFDWALPGGVDEEDRALFGGMLIWHVDERVIRQGLVQNEVNANPTHRGVDLEEADSGQDLGFPSENPFAPQADLGSPFDFWYEGNPTVVVNQAGQEIALYQNRLGPDTYPNSETNDGGESFVVLEGFSLPGTEMSFTYRRVGGETAEPHAMPNAEAVQDVLNAEGVHPEAASVWPLEGGRTVIDVQRQDGAWLVMLAGPAADLQTFDALTPSAHVGDQMMWVTRAESELRLVQFDPRTDGLTMTRLPGSANAVVAGPLLAMDGSAYVLARVGGQTLVYAIRAGAITQTDVSEVAEPLGLVAIATDGAPEDVLLVVGRDGATTLGGEQRWSYAIDAETPPMAGRDEAGPLVVLADEGGSSYVLLETGGEVHRLAAENATRHAGLLDFTGDGQLDVLVPGDSVLAGFNRSGAGAAGFPLRTRGGVQGAPVMGTDASGNPMLFVPLSNGSIDGFVREDARVFRIPGFPLTTGAPVVSLSLATATSDDASPVLYALTESGSLHAWALAGVDEVVWPGIYGGPERRSFVRAQMAHDPGTPADDRLLVRRETYNWPNPIRTGATHIRCVTTEDSRVVITIVDGAGTLVDELTLESVRAGVPSEVHWETNASSGLYFARVRATSASGREDTHLVKMAVIR